MITADHLIKYHSQIPTRTTTETFKSLAKHIAEDFSSPGKQIDSPCHFKTRVYASVAAVVLKRTNYDVVSPLPHN